MNDAILSVACAWNTVPSHIFRKAWRKLWPVVMFARGSSESKEEEEAERCSTKLHKTFAHILGLAREGLFCPGHRHLPGTGRAVKEAPAASLLAEADGDADQVEKVAGEDAVSQVAWEQAVTAFEALQHFAEQQPCFSSQEVGQLHTLHSDFRRQLQLSATVKLEDLQDRPGGCRATAHPTLPCSSTVGDN